MRKSLVKLLGGVVILLLTTAASAVGMGSINVASALGQPLKADIDLVVVSNTEKASLVARLASPEVYKGAGLEYPYGNKFKFQIEARPNGDPYLKVTSEQPINDPFVNMLIEMSWSSGKLMREYTFLLDPAGYDAGMPPQAEVQAIAPSVQAAEPTPASENVAPPAQIVEKALPAEVPAKPVQKAISVPAPAHAAVPTPSRSAENTGNIANPEWVSVRNGDTVNKIAVQHTRADVSLERMLVAIYRVNAEQFDGKNINRIRAGKILRLPDQKELASLTQLDAEKEIHAQTADWNAYRQKLAGATSKSSQAQTSRQVSSGKISSSVSDSAPTVKEPVKEVLKLSKGEAPGDHASTAAGGKSSAQDKKNAALEDAIAKDKAAKDEKARTAMLEKNLADMKHLAELKSEAAAIAKLPVSSTSAVVPVSAVAAVSGTVAASAVKPSTPVKQKPKPKVVEEPSLVDQILEEPLYLAGGAAALLALLGAGLMLRRRRKSPVVAAEESEQEEIGEISGRIAAPVVPSPETGDFTRTVVHKVETVEDASDVDPISEADLFLNFGRDAQAEEILKEALKSTPNNIPVILKLMSIYLTRKDVDSFTPMARQIKDSGDADAWKQAAEMGRKLDPSNPIYGGSKTIEDAGSATMLTTPISAVSQAKPATPDFVVENSPVGQASSLDVDFDLGSDKPANLSTKVIAAAPTAAVKNVALESPALTDIDNMLLDLSSQTSKPGVKTPQSAEPEKVDDAGMEFTLDIPVESPVAKTPPPADVGLGDISLNFDAPPMQSPVSAETVIDGKDEHWHEVATKLDLAKAYQEMGDTFGAREILDEVVREGDDEQRATAQSMLSQLG